MKERKVDVYLGERFVGTLAETADRRTAFAYSDEWLETGLAISPFSLPVSRRSLFQPTVIFMACGVCLLIAYRMPGASCWSIACYKDVAFRRLM